MFIVRMGVNGKTIDVTGRFDDVTGQHNLSLTYIIREKQGKFIDFLTMTLYNKPNIIRNEVSLCQGKDLPLKP